MLNEESERQRRLHGTCRVGVVVCGIQLFYFSYLSEADEVALPTDRRFAENLRYARKEESMKRIDDTPLYKLRIADMGALAMTVKGKRFMIYNSVEERQNRGEHVAMCAVC